MESVLVDFLKWLNKKYAASTSGSRLSRVKRIAKYYDILDEYTNDKCTSLMDDLTFTKSDLDAGGEIKTDIIIKGNYITGLTSLRQALSDFVDYLDSINYCVPSCVHSYGIRTLPSVIPSLWNISVLIPRSGKLDENRRIYAVKESLKTLRSIANQNAFEFPEKLML